VVYDGFKEALKAGVPKDKAASSWTSSSAAPSSATPRKTATPTCCPAEKSGQDEFDFEYGEDFAKHIEAFNPTFCKVLVRYNPEGDKTLNQRQAARLKRLSDYLPARAAASSCSSYSCPPSRPSSTASRRQKSL